MKKLKGRWRLLFGFCPECNSDAPKLYDCNVCGWYQTSASGMPSKEIKREWWRRFLLSIEETRKFRFLTGRDKPFFVDTFRALLNRYDREEISMSKLVEELNLRALDWKNKK